MAVNLAEKYSDKVDERFKLQSLTEAGVNHDYKWDGVKTIHIYSFPTVALNDYDRTAATNRYGTPKELEDNVQDATLTQDKAFTFVIDKGNNVDSMNVRGAGKALQREIDEVIVPTKDAYRLKVMSDASKEAGGEGSTVLTKANSYEAFLNGQEYLDNNKVPRANRVCFASAKFYKFIKQDPSFIRSGDSSQSMLVKGQVGEIDGTKLIVVPTSYLDTGVDFIITHPSAVVAADKLADYKIHENPVGIDGNVVEGRVYYDAFVLNEKKNAIYTNRESA